MLNERERGEELVEERESGEKPRRRRLPASLQHRPFVLSISSSCASSKGTEGISVSKSSLPSSLLSREPHRICGFHLPVVDLVRGGGRSTKSPSGALRRCRGHHQASPWRPPLTALPWRSSIEPPASPLPIHPLPASSRHKPSAAGSRVQRGHPEPHHDTVGDTAAAAAAVLPRSTSRPSPATSTLQI